MTYDEWLAGVPPEISNDPLWKMEVFQLALFAGDLAWQDINKLTKDKRTASVADQLYRAVGSIGANIAEGYSRKSGKDQARFYEYALGSARETRVWYYQARHILPKPVLDHRMQLLTQITHLLLTIIPAQRGYKLSETPQTYTLSNILDNPPLP